jgi:threonine/homoserine/homoserine lactone efflux protein
MRRTVAIEPTQLRDGEWIYLYASSLFYSLTNPLMFLLFTAALPAVSPSGEGSHVLPLAAGVFIGSTAWWIVLSSGVAVVRDRISRDLLTLTNKAAGLILATLGTMMLAKTIPYLIQ